MQQANYAHIKWPRPPISLRSMGRSSGGAPFVLPALPLYRPQLSPPFSISISFSFSFSVWRGKFSYNLFGLLKRSCRINFRWHCREFSSFQVFSDFAHKPLSRRGQKGQQTGH